MGCERTGAACRTGVPTGVAIGNDGRTAGLGFLGFRGEDGSFIAGRFAAALRPIGWFAGLLLLALFWRSYVACWAARMLDSIVAKVSSYTSFGQSLFKSEAKGLTRSWGSSKCNDKACSLRLSKWSRLLATGHCPAACDLMHKLHGSRSIEGAANWALGSIRASFFFFLWRGLRGGGPVVIEKECKLPGTSGVGASETLKPPVARAEVGTVRLKSIISLCTSLISTPEELSETSSYADSASEAADAALFFFGFFCFSGLLSSSKS